MLSLTRNQEITDGGHKLCLVNDFGQSRNANQIARPKNSTTINDMLFSNAGAKFGIPPLEAHLTLGPKQMRLKRDETLQAQFFCASRVCLMKPCCML